MLPEYRFLFAKADEFVRCPSVGTVSFYYDFGEADQIQIGGSIASGAYTITVSHPSEITAASDSTALTLGFSRSILFRRCI